MKHAAALERAGIPAERRDDMLRMMERYLKVYRDALEQPAATNEKLDKVIAATKKLRKHIDGLPEVMRQSLGNLMEWQAHEEQPLDRVIERAQQLKRTGKKPGRPRGSINGSEAVTDNQDEAKQRVVALDGLLYDFATLWAKEMPNVPGIKREHPHTRYLSDGGGETGEESAARTHGPLLDLAECVLSSEEIEFTSRAALGQRLYRLAKEVAATGARAPEGVPSFNS